MATIVGRDEAWRRNERRRFRVTVLDEDDVAVDLTGLALEWLLTLSQTDTTEPQLHKAAADFETPEGAPITNIAVWEVSETESASIPAGKYWMELWDRTNDCCLLAGTVILLPGRGEYGGS